MHGWDRNPVSPLGYFCLRLAVFKSTARIQAENGAPARLEAAKSSAFSPVVRRIWSCVDLARPGSFGGLPLDFFILALY